MPPPVRSKCPDCGAMKLNVDAHRRAVHPPRALGPKRVAPSQTASPPVPTIRRAPDSVIGPPPSPGQSAEMMMRRARAAIARLRHLGEHAGACDCCGSAAAYLRPYIASGAGEPAVRLCGACGDVLKSTFGKYVEGDRHPPVQGRKSVKRRSKGEAERRKGGPVPQLLPSGHTKKPGSWSSGRHRSR